ncbi:TPA: electron transport complex protein RnfC, partial [bacterium]|nr:electron transport complex protein RnfC [bacterium]
AKVRGATGAKRAIIALKKKYKSAWSELEKHAKKFGVELFPLGSFYPAGDEVTLVYEVTGRVIPEASLPMNVGCLVQNVHTLCWIDDADSGAPVTERYVTVGGAVRHPTTFLAPIGTPVSDLIEKAGGASVENYVIIDGGPMMGKFV